MTTKLTYHLQFHTDASDFLQVAGEHLAAHPVISTVVTVIAHRRVSQRGNGIDGHDGDWWLTVHGANGQVVGAGMRTASFEPRPPFLLPMPEQAATAVAQALHRRGEEVRQVNGAIPTVQIVADELARLTGGSVETSQHTRLFELRELVEPKPVAGRLAAATEADVDLVREWTAAFMGDADEQAGRPRGVTAHDVPDKDRLLDRLGRGEFHFWLDASSTPVHLTGVSPPSFGVARIGPVYTPPGERGRGWASNAVAQVSSEVLLSGARVCLFTDQANPTSNGIYTSLGYRPVADMANLAISR